MNSVHNILQVHLYQIMAADSDSIGDGQGFKIVLISKICDYSEQQYLRRYYCAYF